MSRLSKHVPKGPPVRTCALRGQRLPYPPHGYAYPSRGCTRTFHGVAWISLGMHVVVVFSRAIVGRGRLGMHAVYVLNVLIERLVAGMLKYGFIDCMSYMHSSYFVNSQVLII